MRALAPILLLGACELVDQTTFQPEPDVPAPAHAPDLALPETRPPLVTIRFGQGTPDYAAALQSAVGAAEARRPDIEYTVVTVIPSLSDPPSQATLIALGRADATVVERDMLDLGVPASRIRLGARIDPRLTEREVLIYVR